ncbi:hypothetical protein J6590_038531 [Homalodisca vitripennis]|nr:hypothetical protein J6590_038531 [Homalodisca vitripennis]
MLSAIVTGKEDSEGISPLFEVECLWRHENKKSLSASLFIGLDTLKVTPGRNGGRLTKQHWENVVLTISTLAPRNPERCAICDRTPPHLGPRRHSTPSPAPRLDGLGLRDARYFLSPGHTWHSPALENTDFTIFGCISCYLLFMNGLSVFAQYGSEARGSASCGTRIIKVLLTYHPYNGHYLYWAMWGDYKCPCRPWELPRSLMRHHCRV